MSIRRESSLGDGLEDLAGLIDLLLELEEVVEVTLDLVEGQVDEHAGDLGSKVFADELLDVLVDELTHELLQVRVLRHDSREHAKALKVVGVDLRLGMSKVRGTLDLDSGGSW